MFRIRILLFIPFLAAWQGMSQEVLTIDSCYRLAEKNWPLVNQIDLIAGSNDLKI